MDFSKIKIGGAGDVSGVPGGVPGVDSSDGSEVVEGGVGGIGGVDDSGFDSGDDSIKSEGESSSGGSSVGGSGVGSTGTLAFQRLRESVLGGSGSSGSGVVDSVDDSLVEDDYVEVVDDSDEFFDNYDEDDGFVVDEGGVPVSGGGVPVSGGADSYDELLSDLLEDEVEDASSSSSSSSSGMSSVKNASGSSGGGELVGEGSGVLGVPVDGAFEPVDARDFLTVRDRKQKAVRAARNEQRTPGRAEAKERKRVARHSRSSVHKGSRRGLDSTWAQRGPQEHVVDDGGIPDSVLAKRGDAGAFESLLKSAEVHGDVRLPEGGVERFAGATGELLTNDSQRGSVVYPWSKPHEVQRALDVEQKGRGKDFVTRRKQSKMNQRELDFFRNLQGKKSELVDDADLVELVRAPKRESASERKRRLAVVNAAVGGSRGYTKKVRSSLTSLDLEYLRFIAKFRYATARHMGRLNGVTEASALKRLKSLKGKGLVNTLPLWGAGNLWVVTQAGMLLSGFDLPLITENTFSPMYVPHQFTVNNTAGNLWGGQVNVLQLPDFPDKRRTTPLGRLVPGEEVVSETEINSSFSRLRMGTTAELYRPQIINATDDEFRAWEDAGGAAAGLPSPEMHEGNEFMWVLLPPFGQGKNHHVPDLVVPRPRNADGSPESIAVEIELGAKKKYDYDSTLRAYRADHRIFKKVIWVCKDTYPARVLEESAKELGLWDEGRIDIVPVLTENGIFTGRDLWKI